MQKLLIRFLAVIVGLFLAAELVPGVHLDGLYTALIVVVLLGAVNLIVRPILVILTLPVTILTLGLFLLVVNAVLFWFVGSFVEGFDVAGFGSAFLGSLIVSTTSWVANKLT
jgi:putative membrane protein